MLISFFYPNLSVCFDEPVQDFWLVHWLDEHGITGDGKYQRIEREDVSHVLFGARFDDDEVERFLMDIGHRNSLFDVGPTMWCFDASSTLGRLLECGDLVAVRRARELDPERKTLMQERETVREFIRLQKSIQLIPGRRCVLVSGADYNVVPNRERYQVVRHAETTNLLKAAIAGSQATSHARGLLDKVVALLAPDWRPPQLPKGLVLLREIPLVVASQKPAAALTPSQIRSIMEKATLVIHVVDLKGRPQAGLAFEIKTPDDHVVSGKLDEEGRGRAKSSSEGVFTVTFTELDGADWDGDGALPLDEALEQNRSEASRYKVEQGDRLPTIAHAKGFARWKTIWDFADNASLKKLRGTAHILLPGDDLSIPAKLIRKAEVPGGTAEYVVQSAAEVLRVRFVGMASSAEQPVTFKATPDKGDAIEGVLEGDGTMEIDLEADTRKVHVDLFYRETEKDNDGADGVFQGEESIASYDLNVGELDPATEISGIQARLFNLGFYDGDITGKVDDGTRTAISHFRWAKLRDRKDTVDDGFLAALKDVHCA